MFKCVNSPNDLHIVHTIFLFEPPPSSEPPLKKGKHRHHHERIEYKEHLAIKDSPELPLMLGVAFSQTSHSCRHLSGRSIASAAWRVVGGESSVALGVALLFSIVLGCPLLFLSSPCGEPYFLCLPVYKEGNVK